MTDINATAAKTAGVVSLSGALTLNNAGQDLTITGGTLDTKGRNLTVNDSFTLTETGTLRLNGDETVSGGPDSATEDTTIWYDDSEGTTTITNITYGNLVIGSTGSAVFHLPSSLDLNGHLTISGGTLAVTNAQGLSVSGSMILTSGSFTPGTGSVTLDGRNSALTLSGKTFNTLTVSGAGNPAVTGNRIRDGKQRGQTAHDAWLQDRQRHQAGHPPSRDTQGALFASRPS